MINKNNIQNKIYYEISEEELEELKIQERSNGRADVANYILYSFKYFTLKKNMAGLLELLTQVLRFLYRVTNKIENKKGYDFWQYVDIEEHS